MYSYLKGTETKITRCIWDGEVKEGFVAGISIDVGLSIVDIDDPDNEIVCINAEELKGRGGNFDNYKKCFDYIVSCLENNEPIDIDKGNMIINGETTINYLPFYNGMSCGFK